MRKNSYIPKVWGGFTLPQFSFNGFSWGKSKSKKKDSSKQPESITIRLNTYDQEKYTHSFLKKRILTTWKEQRPQVQVLALFPQSIEKQVIQHTYNRLKPLLLASYNEDFNQPYTEFAFRSWLQYVKLLAEITGKYRDAKQWDELGKFISTCSQYNLVDL